MWMSSAGLPHLEEMTTLTTAQRHLVEQRQRETHPFDAGAGALRIPHFTYPNTSQRIYFDDRTLSHHNAIE